MRQFLLQMHGESGAGKSTLAIAVGRATGAVVIDKDVIKSRLLDGEQERGLMGLPEDVAAPMHHAIHRDLAAVILKQGFSVILDGAAFFPLIRQKGQAMAEAAGAAYYIIECRLPDLDVLQRRIDAKELMSSQPREASLDGWNRPGTALLTEAHLTLDTRRTLEECLAQALRYIGYDAG